MRRATTIHRKMYDGGSPNYAETYPYEFDKQRNWTKRTTFGPDLLDQTSKPQLQSITNREIVYY